jgi:solute carrier family 25 carnitine/acylcarnitine transporter 20/29
MDAASQLYKQGGVKRLYAGLVPCLLRASPANAGMLFVVDKVKQVLDGV